MPEKHFVTAPEYAIFMLIPASYDKISVISD